MFIHSFIHVEEGKVCWKRGRTKLVLPYSSGPGCTCQWRSSSALIMYWDQDQWRTNHWGGGMGAGCHPWQWKICQKSGKRGKKSGKNWGKKRKNREENAKIRKVLSLSPSWQIGLAMLLTRTSLVLPHFHFISPSLTWTCQLWEWSIESRECLASYNKLSC